MEYHQLQDFGFLCKTWFLVCPIFPINQLEVTRCFIWRKKPGFANCSLSISHPVLACYCVTCWPNRRTRPVGKTWRRHSWQCGQCSSSAIAGGSRAAERPADMIKVALEPSSLSAQSSLFSSSLRDSSQMISRGRPSRNFWTACVSGPRYRASLRKGMRQHIHNSFTCCVVLSPFLTHLHLSHHTCPPQYTVFSAPVAPRGSHSSRWTSLWTSSTAGSETLGWTRCCTPRWRGSRSDRSWRNMRPTSASWREVGFREGGRKHGADSHIIISENLMNWCCESLRKT